MILAQTGVVCMVGECYVRNEDAEKNRKTSYDKISTRYSKLCVGMSGADISTICNEASINAVTKDKKFIEKDDIIELLSNDIIIII